MRIFSWEHMWFLRALLMVAEATKQMGVGIQYNMQLQSFSPSAGEALGIQPPRCSLALPPSWAPAFTRKNFTQQLFFSVKCARAGTGATVLTQPTVQSTFILIPLYSSSPVDASEALAEAFAVT